MKGALGAMMLVLLACGQGDDGPTSSPPSPAGLAAQDSMAVEKDPAELRDYFTWGDTSQPARDWDVDADACKARVDEDPQVREGVHPLARVGVFVKCMEETGWAFKAKNR